MSARFGLRAAQSTFRPAFRQQATSNFRFAQRKLQSTAAEAGAENEAGFSKFWNSKVGPKTVHFWAPIMKWGLVLAGAADFARPAQDLSLSQNSALMATGLIWTRWCFVIKPRNVFLASVNFLLFCVGATQVTRVVMYQQSLKGESAGQVVKEDAAQDGKNLEQAVEKAGEKIQGK